LTSQTRKTLSVSGKEKEYITKSPALFQNLFSTILLFLVMICYIINVDSAPAHINLRQLTMDSRIVQYWPLSIAFVFTIPFIIGIILYRKETDLILVEKSEILVLDDRRSKKMIIYMWCVLPLLFISGVGMGIVDGNYANLIFYGGGILYLITFFKFVSFLDIKCKKITVLSKQPRLSVRLTMTAEISDKVGTYYDG